MPDYFGRSDSFGLLPSPRERVTARSDTFGLLYQVPVDPADETNCESCQ